MRTVTFKKLAAQYCAIHDQAGQLIRFALNPRADELLQLGADTQKTILKQCGVNADDAEAVYLFEMHIGIRPYMQGGPL